MMHKSQFQKIDPNDWFSYWLGSWNKPKKQCFVSALDALTSVPCSCRSWMWWVMPGHSTGSHHKTRPHSSSRSRADGYRQNRSYSRDSSTSQETYKENYSEQPRSIDSQFPRKTHPLYANGRGSETLGFIPGSADSPQGTQACGSCASLGWSGCKALLCCVLTCGFMGLANPACRPTKAPLTTL